MKFDTGKPVQLKTGEPIFLMSMVNRITNESDYYIDLHNGNWGEPRHLHVWNHEDLVFHDYCEICGLVRVKNENVSQPEKA